MKKDIWHVVGKGKPPVDDHEIVEKAIRDWKNWEMVRSIDGRNALAVARGAIWRQVRGKLRLAQWMDAALERLEADGVIEQVIVATKGRRAKYIILA